MIKFERVQTEEDRIAMHKLRYDVFCLEKQFLDANDYPEEMEYDEWDEYSTHFIASGEMGIIATARLIPNDIIKLPIEKYFDIEIPSDSSKIFAEFSRLIVHPTFRGMSFQVTGGLYAAMYNYSRKEGITDWYAILDKHLHNAYSQYGFLFRQIGEPRHCFGDVTAPYVVSLEEARTYFKTHNPALYKLLLRP